MGGVHLVTLGFKVALGFNRCHATSARRRDGLAIYAILDIARVKYADNIGSRAAFRNNVTVGIEVDLSYKRLGVRDVANGEKESVDILIPGPAGCQRAKLHRADFV